MENESISTMTAEEFCAISAHWGLSRKILYALTGRKQASIDHYRTGFAAVPADVADRLRRFDALLTAFLVDCETADGKYGAGSVPAEK